MAIGDRIRSRREEIGMTQQQLADLLGYKSKSAINKIEMGINGVSQKRIVDFARALNTSIEYLMEMDEDQPYYLDGDARELAEFLHKNPDYKVLFDASRKVSRDDIEFVRKMIERFSK